MSRGEARVTRVSNEFVIAGLVPAISARGAGRETSEILLT
jgi:hypothetical protein